MRIVTRPIDKVRRRLLATTVAGALSPAARAFSSEASAAIEGPIAGGPVFTGDRDTATPSRLKESGYLETEYLVSGSVRGRPYVTTLLVRRPADLKRFSGLVVVEPLHVGGSSVLWPYGGDVILEGGHGYALLGAQRIPVNQAVKPTNPARYARLTIPEATPAEIAAIPLTGVLAAAPPELAGQLRASVAEGPISHEIMSQVGALLKGPAGARPFGRTPRWLVTGGYSQTGQLTLNYLRGAAQNARLASGAPIYDGFMPLGSSGETPLPRHPGKVIQALGEGDYLNYAATRGDAYRRPDSDQPGDLYRLYELAGASHIPTRGAITPEARANYAAGEHPSQAPSVMLYAAAISNLLAWVIHDAPPPRAERLRLAGDRSVMRDAQGNALGGVRSSYLDVPTARVMAVAPPREGSFNRNFYGLEVPLTKDSLRGLYPTHAAYVAKVQTSVAALTQARWLRPSDGEALLREAEAAAIP